MAASLSTIWMTRGRREQGKTRIGMRLAFQPTASRALADIPAQVVAIGPRFRSGEYLVTLEYARPIQYRNEVIRRIDAFRSELYEPGLSRAA